MPLIDQNDYVVPSKFKRDFTLMGNLEPWLQGNRNHAQRMLGMTVLLWEKLLP